MNVVLVATAVAVVTGAIVAVSSRDARFVLPGLGLCLVLAPLVVDPLPDAPPFVARAAGGLLAVELLWVALRRRTAPLSGAFVGWPATVAAAAAAAVAGYAVAQGAGSGGLLFQDIGAIAVLPIPEARAAGFALVAISVTAVLMGRDLVRLAIGGLILITGTELVRTGVVGPAGGLEHLLVAAVTAMLPVVVVLGTSGGAARGESGGETSGWAARGETGGGAARGETGGGAAGAEADRAGSHTEATDDRLRGRRT